MPGQNTELATRGSESCFSVGCEDRCEVLKETAGSLRYPDTRRTPSYLLHPALNSELWKYALNTEFGAAVGMLRKKCNRHSKAETIL